VPTPCSRRLFLSSFVGAVGIAALPSAVTHAQGVTSCETVNPGLVSATEYVGPGLGKFVAWDPELWEVANPTNLAAVFALPTGVAPIACGFGNGASDLITLAHRTYESSILLVKTVELGLWTFDDFANIFTQPTFAGEFRLPEGSEVLLTETFDDRVGVIAQDSAHPEHIVYAEYRIAEAERLIQSATLHLWVPEVYASTLDDVFGVQIEDFELFTVFAPDTILDAIG